MARKTGPYVGVTGFMTPEESAAAIYYTPPGLYKLMVGVLMSSKTLQGLPNKWPGRYPLIDRVSSIFVNDPRALNLIHYNTDELGGLSGQLEQLDWIGGPHLDGFQLNIAWPQVNEIERYRAHVPDTFIVLQIGGKAMEISGSVTGCAERVKEYSPFIDAILVDPSGGHGMPFVPEVGQQYLGAIRDKCPDIGIGIAGGLCAETLDSVAPLFREFPGLSIDAEGRLRTPQPEDRMDANKLFDYVEKAFYLV